MRNNATLTYKQIRDLFFPIGSIKIQLDNTNPSTLIGGEWELIEDNTFIASKGLVNAGSIGGDNNAIVVEHNHTANTTDGTLSGIGSGQPSRSAILSGSGFCSVSSNGNTGQSFGGTGCSWETTYKATLNHTHTIENKGESGTNKNMPKYLSCYIFKRIA